MRIGVPKERKTDESRVALRPDQAEKLAAKGHQVFIEAGAGAKSGFEDNAYQRHGGQIVDTGEVYRKAELILKVKCPLESEYSFYTPDHVLFTFLHFDENIKPANMLRIIGTGVTAIAYEWVERNGKFPLLQPMSELTGAVFARKAMSLLMENKGSLGGRYVDHWPAATAMVIGGGHIGCNAINVFAQNHFHIIAVDKHPETLQQRLAKYMRPGALAGADMQLLTFDEQNPDCSIAQLEAYLEQTDILIGAAVRRQTLPKSKCEFMIDRTAVAMMAKNSVVCDATACDCDLMETCVSSESLTHTYIEEDVIHYNCDHIPALVGATATRILTEATFPYVESLADGFEAATRRDEAIFKAVMCYGGKLTHEYSARKKNLEYAPLANLLSGTTREPVREKVCATL